MYLSTPIKQALRPFISPEQYDFWARELGSIAAWDRCFARVVSRSDEAVDCFTLRLKPNGNMPAYQSGQHINLSAVIEGRRVTRSYSLTSLPNEPELAITLRREPHGQMSNWLYENATPGARLEIGAVFGEMTLEHCAVQPTDNLIFLAAGSGITPLYSLIRAALARGHSGAIQLVYWDKTADHFCFNAELDALATRHQLSIHRVTTREESAKPLAGERISSTQLQALCGAPLTSSPKIFMCGGADFVAAARDCLNALGQRDIYAEAFSAPIADKTPADVDTLYQVELTQSGRRLEVSSRTNLLNALEAAGIPVESGCRMGICNTCSCSTPAGTTLDTTTGLMNSGSATRLCISQARSNLILDL